MNTPETKSTPELNPKLPVRWGLWIKLSLFVILVVFLTVVEKLRGPTNHNQNAWSGAIETIGEDVCDGNEWSTKASECNQLAAEARDRARKRFEPYQR